MASVRRRPDSSKKIPQDANFADRLADNDGAVAAQHQRLGFAQQLGHFPARAGDSPCSVPVYVLVLDLAYLPVARSRQ
jgi:hypothetical protein